MAATAELHQPKTRPHMGTYERSFIAWALMMKVLLHSRELTPSVVLTRTVVDLEKKRPSSLTEASKFVRMEPKPSTPLEAALGRSGGWCLTTVISQPFRYVLTAQCRRSTVEHSSRAVRLTHPLYSLQDESADPELLKLSSDRTLFEDDGFKPFAEKFRDSQDEFFESYAKAHKQLSELGSKFEPAEGILL